MKFNATAPSPAPPPAPKEPYFFRPVEYLVIAPMIQSVYIGLLAGLTTGLPAPILAWWGAGIPNPGKIGLSVGGFVMVITAGVSFYFLTKVWLKISENLFRRDINGDGSIGGGTPAAPPQIKYNTPVWVHDDPENPNNGRRVDIETPEDSTLQRMAVILAVRGWDYFTADNFTSSKSETQLMSYDHWRDVFLPAMKRARLVETTKDSRGRERVQLSPMGKEAMKKLSGAMDRSSHTPAPILSVEAQ